MGECHINIKLIPTPTERGLPGDSNLTLECNYAVFQAGGGELLCGAVGSLTLLFIFVFNVAAVPFQQLGIA